MTARLRHSLMGWVNRCFQALGHQPFSDRRRTATVGEGQAHSTKNRSTGFGARLMSQCASPDYLRRTLVPGVAGTSPSSGDIFPQDLSYKGTAHRTDPYPYVMYQGQFINSP